MEPFYQCKHGVLYSGDCVNIMPHLDKSDILLTDPPYGIAEKIIGGGEANRPKDLKLRENLKRWDIIPTKECFDLMFQKSKNQIIFGGNYFPEYLSHSRGWAVWDKLISPEFTFAQGELVYTSFNKNLKIYRMSYCGDDTAGRVYRKFHPTEKPVRLLRNLMADFAKDATTVLDPFAGSGSTALACIESNRKFILVEKDLDYCKIIVSRIEKVINQVTIYEI
jgi:DNA modification methylase